MFTVTTKLKIMQIVLSISVLFALMYASTFIFAPAEKALGEIDSAGCQITKTVLGVGNQSSVLLVGTSTNRASLHIQQIENATNTAYLSFGYASATVSGSTWRLASSTGVNKNAFIGKNTDFPYTGPITVITDVGSSTLLVTECNY